MKKKILLLLSFITVIALAGKAQNIHYFGPASPKVFNVKAFQQGPMGDGVIVSDGAINNGSANFTTTTTTFTQADVGKWIKVDSAGAGSIDLVTTIIAVGGAHSITLNTTAGHTVTNATTKYGTDCTPGIQAAVIACQNAGGGVVYSPGGIYILAGALQTAVSGPFGSLNPNCQIQVPMIPFATVSGLSSNVIEFRGESRPSPATSVINVYQQPNNGSVWLSFATGSGTYPSILATGATNDVSRVNASDIRITDMNFQVIENAVGNNGPGMCGLNLGNFADAMLDGVFVTIDAPYKTSVKPTNSVFGINMIPSREGTWNYANNTLVGGFKWGYVFGEHFYGGDIQAMACQIALSPAYADHVSTIERVGVYWCNFAIKPDVGYGSLGLGHHRLNIEELSMEVDTLTGDWYHQTFSISDASNFLFGRCSHGVVLKGQGYDNTFFTTTGGVNYNNYTMDQSFTPAPQGLDATLTVSNNTTQEINITGVATNRPSMKFGNTFEIEQISNSQSLVGQNLYWAGSSYQYIITDNGEQWTTYDNGGGTNGAIIAQFAVSGTGGTTATVKAPFQIDGNSTGGIVWMGGNQSAYDGTGTGAIVGVDNTNIFPFLNLTTDNGKSGNAWRDIYYSHTISKTAIGASSGLGTNVTSMTPAGSDEDFSLTVVTSGNVSGTIGTVTFGRSWGVTPNCTVSSANSTTGSNIGSTSGNYVAFTANAATTAILTGATTGANTFVFQCHCGL